MKRRTRDNENSEESTGRSGHSQQQQQQRRRRLPQQQQPQQQQRPPSERKRRRDMRRRLDLRVSDQARFALTRKQRRPYRSQCKTNHDQSSTSSTHTKKEAFDKLMTLLIEIDPSFKEEAVRREQQRDRHANFGGENAAFNRIELLQKAASCLLRLSSELEQHRTPNTSLTATRSERAYNEPVSTKACI